MKRLILYIAVLCSISVVYAQDKPLKVALLADLHISPGNYNDSIMPTLVDDVNREKYDLIVIA